MSMGNVQISEILAWFKLIKTGHEHAEVTFSY